MPFKREDQRRKRVKLTVAIFLRSDIFYYVKLVSERPSFQQVNGPAAAQIASNKIDNGSASTARRNRRVAKPNCATAPRTLL